MCEAYIDTRHSPKTTDNSTTFLNSNINPESKPTKCEICININIKANRIYLDKLKESTGEWQIIFIICFYLLNLDLLL